MTGGAYSNRAMPDGEVPDARGMGLIWTGARAAIPGYLRRGRNTWTRLDPRRHSPLTVTTTSRHGVVWIVVRGERTCSPAIN